MPQKPNDPVAAPEHYIAWTCPDCGAVVKGGDHACSAAPVDEYPEWETECINCGRERHFLGVFCWWGVPPLVLMLLIALGAVAHAVYVAVTK